MEIIGNKEGRNMLMFIILKVNKMVNIAVISENNPVSFNKR